jgi:hypothetical protein
MEVDIDYQHITVRYMRTMWEFQAHILLVHLDIPKFQLNLIVLVLYDIPKRAFAVCPRPVFSHPFLA